MSFSEQSITRKDIEKSSSQSIDTHLISSATVSPAVGQNTTPSHLPSDSQFTRHDISTPPCYLPSVPPHEKDENFPAVLSPSFTTQH